jgi:hypothetical protein
VGDAPIDAPADAVNCPGAYAAPGPLFGASVAISDPANQAFTPSIAVNNGVVVVAWHDFPAGTGTSRVVTAAIVGGCVGPIEPVPETLANPKRVTIAATASGFVLAYDVLNGLAVRTIALDANGHAVGSPVTLSASGLAGAIPHVAAHGDDVVFAWTDGTAHYFARQGPVETVAATPVGTTLQSTGLLNYPSIALASNGTATIGYRDGGTSAINWDILLVSRPTGGVFSAPVDVSNSPGMDSDSVALATEANDTLDIVWCEQDPAHVNNFETEHASRTAGVVSSPARFGVQGTQTWSPAVVGGFDAVWSTGGASGGPLWLAQNGAPQAILPADQGAAPALAHDASLHLAFETSVSPRQIRYAIQR